MRERFANQSGCDAEALRDERVKHGLECREQCPSSRVNEHAECSPHGETTRLCHLPAHSLVDQKEIGPKRFGDEYRRGLSWIQPKV
ncbi:MAG: hypothetical protein A3I61_15540 [Acidobacteria bacterium RIFCSPLOWO2_02_FULL_68_18]|nr:MAG: hypothetical protein A3I61_15540 [Acidobacteria bacterium RIFCSPLOWO2_02_FULL_68_18]OFW50511.1 MAG: hypothetical protein A3G77_00235 [Acidobacteria bacterium RIFCSPLOWO2_12_FULL_68_19]